MPKKNRLTILIGAGAVVEASAAYENRVDTNTITNQILNDAPPQSKRLLNTIYKDLKKNCKRYTDYNPNFEDLFHALEVLKGIFTGEDAAPEYKPIYKYFMSVKKKYAKFNPYTNLTNKRPSNPDHAVYEAQSYLIKAVQKNIESYSDKDVCEWYKTFFEGLKNNFDLDIFTLNYDTWFEKIFKRYNDGFFNTHENSEFFEFLPNKVLNSKYTVNINHLHGQIDFRTLSLDKETKKMFNDYDFHTIYKIKNLKKTKRQLDICTSDKTTQAGEHLKTCPIIMGKIKLEKTAFPPLDSYRTNFHNCIVNNPNILIIGYGFADFYIDNLLSQFHKIHGNNKRVNIIDYCSQEDWNNYHMAPFELYGHKLRTLFGLCGDTDIDKIRRYSQIINLNENRFHLYLKGFKHTTQQHFTDIMKSYN